MQERLLAELAEITQSCPVCKPANSYAGAEHCARCHGLLYAAVVADQPMPSKVSLAARFAALVR